MSARPHFVAVHRGAILILAAFSLYIRDIGNGWADSTVTTNAPLSSATSKIEFTAESSLDEIKETSDKGNASAEYQLAIRLIDEKAREQASSEALKGAESDVGAFKTAHFDEFIEFENASGLIYWQLAHIHIRQDTKDNDVTVDRVDEQLLVVGKDGVQSPLTDTANYVPEFVSTVNQYQAAMAKPVVQQYFSKVKDVQKLFSVIVLKERDQIVQLLQSSASQGYVPALLELSKFYSGEALLGDDDHGRLHRFSCEFVPKDEAKSAEYARKAADLGSSEGMLRLATAYLGGNGVVKDESKAVSLLQRAYSKDYLGAYSAMALIYSSGIGSIEKDLQRAYICGRVVQIVLNTPVDQQQMAWRIMANDSVAAARGGLTPEDLLKAEAAADDQAKSVRQRLFPPAPAMAFVPSKDLTKDEWRTRLGKINNLFAQTGILQMGKTEFIKACGQPTRTQTVGENAYWYYECKNGEIQLVIPNFLLQQGQIISQKVNDF